MGINKTEYWEYQCDKCGRFLYNPDTDNSIFYDVSDMHKQEERMGWDTLYIHCDECRKKKEKKGDKQ